MIKKTIFIFGLILFLTANKSLKAQDSPFEVQKIDSLKKELAFAENDSNRVYLMSQLCNYYKFNKPDSAFYYGNKAKALAIEINYSTLGSGIMNNMVLSLILLGNDSQALQLTLEALNYAEKNGLAFGKANHLLNLGKLYRKSGKYKEALDYFRESKSIYDSKQNKIFSSISDALLGETFLLLNQPDSALYHYQQAYEVALQIDNRSWHRALILNGMGFYYFEVGNYDVALDYLRQALSFATSYRDLFDTNFNIARVYHQIGQSDSSIFYGLKSLDFAGRSGIIPNIILGNNMLSENYEESNLKKALEYKKMAMTWKDSLSNLANSVALKSFTEFDEQERQYEIESAKKEYKSRILRLWIFSIAGAFLSALFVAFLLFRNNKNKQKANAQLKSQKEKVENTLDQLKATQSQLIQSEKMASLGELTAGIAHEIQNPLNFVNNFSEVNKELISEMREEISKKNLVEADLIAKDIEENEDKIIHHGKRADAIVKGMLQHSRTSTGQKEPTDFNALADEYLRLAYHGLRAKDKSFNADFILKADESLPKINVIPQDIGRVLLNLINNAFYAVDKKAKSDIDNFKPMVIVDTKSNQNYIEISVKDNGDGIPEKIKDKIFQPFFTTKPTGQGTGLGLSLSYDIVKAHGGEILVESKENDGTEFNIHIPVKT